MKGVPGKWAIYAVANLGWSARGGVYGERYLQSSPGSINDDIADLATIIDTVGPSPAHVAGNSFGACITLRLATERPDLFKSVMLHEPPFLTLLAGDPQGEPMLEESNRRIGAVVERLTSGDHPGAARYFVEEVAFGPGQWDTLPPEVQQTLITNAPTFLDEMQEGPSALEIDLEGLARMTRPTLLTGGDQSPPFFPLILSKLATALPAAEQRVIAGAGHAPHVSHPVEYAEVVKGFCAASR